MMNISSINNLTNTNSYIDNINKVSKDNTGIFESIYKSAISLINETNEYSNAAKEEEIRFALGEDNLVDLMTAQSKANYSLQYTIAIRDKFLEAYKEIMNMQF